MRSAFVRAKGMTIPLASQPFSGGFLRRLQPVYCDWSCDVRQPNAGQSVAISVRLRDERRIGRTHSVRRQKRQYALARLRSEVHQVALMHSTVVLNSWNIRKSHVVLGRADQCPIANARNQAFGRFDALRCPSVQRDKQGSHSGICDKRVARLLANARSGGPESRLPAAGQQIEAHVLLGSVILGWSGEAERAIQSAERGVRLSPFDPWSFAAFHPLILGHFHQGRYEAADLGKYTGGFQNRLRAEVRVDHSTAGAREVENDKSAVAPAMMMRQRRPQVW